MIIGCTSYIKADASTDKIPLNEIYQIYCWEMECEYNVSAPLLMSLIWQESKGNPEARNGRCIGLTQLNPRYFMKAIKELEISDVQDPYQNIRICAYTLRSWYDKYGDMDSYLILTMWNMGEQNALEKYNAKKPPYYAREIIERAEEWTVFYEEEHRRKRP